VKAGTGEPACRCGGRERAHPSRCGWRGGCSERHPPPTSSGSNRMRSWPGPGRRCSETPGPSQPSRLQVAPRAFRNGRRWTGPRWTPHRHPT
jgi:hypothetical protein